MGSSAEVQTASLHIALYTTSTFTKSESYVAMGRCRVNCPSLEQSQPQRRSCNPNGLWGYRLRFHFRLHYDAAILRDYSSHTVSPLRLCSAIAFNILNRLTVKLPKIS